MSWCLLSDDPLPSLADPPVGNTSNINLTPLAFEFEKVSADSQLSDADAMAPVPPNPSPSCPMNPSTPNLLPDANAEGELSVPPAAFIVIPAFGNVLKIPPKTVVPSSGVPSPSWSKSEFFSGLAPPYDIKSSVGHWFLSPLVIVIPVVAQSPALLFAVKAPVDESPAAVVPILIPFGMSMTGSSTSASVDRSPSVELIFAVKVLKCAAWFSVPLESLTFNIMSLSLPLVDITRSVAGVVVISAVVSPTLIVSFSKVMPSVEPAAAFMILLLFRSKLLALDKTKFEPDCDCAEPDCAASAAHSTKPVVELYFKIWFAPGAVSVLILNLFVPSALDIWM